MAKAYAQTVHPRAFTKGQLVLRAAKHVRKNALGPSKFAPKWEGPYIIRKAHDSKYLLPHKGRWDGPDKSYKWEVAEIVLRVKRGRFQYTKTIFFPVPNLLSVSSLFFFFNLFYVMNFV